MENDICKRGIMILTIENFVKRDHGCTICGELREYDVHTYLYLSKDTMTYGDQSSSDDGGAEALIDVERALSRDE